MNPARIISALVCLFSIPALAFVPEDSSSSQSAETAQSMPPGDYEPPVQPASDEGANAIASFKFPSELKAELIAAEPDLANPVAFSIDDLGLFFVCETFRQGNAVTDNRDREYWLLDDLAAQTVEDRRAYHLKHLGAEELAKFTVHDDRIRLLTDTDADGKLDSAQVFSNDYNDAMDGTGAGVLKVGQDVFYTNIPHLWRLRDEDNDGVADMRESVFSGFGVRVAFRGHDMHGLIVGPDGRLYFSIGDRGFNVVNKEGQRLAMPDTGAVFRCEPDGTNLEIFAYGLRNPQELAFDNFGNLFTGDNNSDSGDKARWVHVVEGTDSGWRMYYQYLDDRGPWNREMMWYPFDSPALESEGPGGVPKGSVAKNLQPAFSLPPIKNFTDGPSGLVHYPGVGLPEKYNDHFFLCDFRGTPVSSGLRSFALKPKGASFELVDAEEFIWRMLCTDVGFAPDGTLVLSDWVNGWNGEGKGRLYGFRYPNAESAGQESAQLLAEDFTKRDPLDLVAFFSHRDQRIRQKAHLEVAARPVDEFPISAISKSLQADDSLAAFHSTWALATSLRINPEQYAERMAHLFAAIQYPDPRVAAQAIRATAETLGQHMATESVPAGATTQSLREFDVILLKLLNEDTDPRVTQAALTAIGRLGKSGRPAPNDTFIQSILEVLANHGSSDPVIRHAAQAALGDAVSGDDLRRLGSIHPAVEARIGTVVALRRQRDPQIFGMTSDADPRVLAEIARAINDVPIESGSGGLAALAGMGDGDLSRFLPPTLRRILNANFRAGTQFNAATIRNVALNTDVDARIRVEALEELALWNQPPKTDRVTGMYRPVPERQTDFIPEVIGPHINALIAAKPRPVRIAAINLAKEYRLAEAVEPLTAIATDTQRNDKERVAALEALGAIASDSLGETLQLATSDDSADVRSTARSILAKRDPKAAVPVLAQAAQAGELVEQQSAIKTLAEIQSDTADEILSQFMDRLEQGKIPPGIQLDLLEAAKSRDTIKARAESYEQQHAQDKMTQYAVSLEGGDFDRGKDIFFNWENVSCQRCHKADGHRGGEVGPDLSEIARTKDRHYLLEAIVDPNAKIAENFETLVVVNADGKVISGIKKSETDETLTLITPEAKVIAIPQADILDRAKGQSAMPEDILKHLTPRDIRDLVEFLANQK